MNKRMLGTAYEDRVIALLREKGYRILEHGFKCKFGEIDIIAQSGATLVFVEVKYRSSSAYGMPYEAVDRKKQRRISNSASYYLYKNHYPIHTPCRFDVAAVSPGSIEHLENAFSYCGSWDY